MRMNHPEAKRLLATVRGADYAHAGEEEAIHLVWESLRKDPAQAVLDAGCGRGGTAGFVQAQGWARVTGMDVDAASIREAAARYPEPAFVAADIVEAGRRFPRTFAAVYALNAFYAFPDQAAALASLAEAAAPGATLRIFDYVDRGGFFGHSFARYPETALWKPLDLERISAQLEAAGWRWTGSLRLHDAYRRWYENFLGRFAEKKPLLQEEFPPELVAYAEGYYRALHDAVTDGVLGGAIVTAERTA